MKNSMMLSLLFLLFVPLAQASQNSNVTSKRSEKVSLSQPVVRKNQMTQLQVDDPSRVRLQKLFAPVAQLYTVNVKLKKTE